MNWFLIHCHLNDSHSSVDINGANYTLEVVICFAFCFKTSNGNTEGLLNHKNHPFYKTLLLLPNGS